MNLYGEVLELEHLVVSKFTTTAIEIEDHFLFHSGPMSFVSNLPMNAKISRLIKPSHLVRIIGSRLSDRVQGI